MRHALHDLAPLLVALLVCFAAACGDGDAGSGDGGIPDGNVPDGGVPGTTTIDAKGGVATSASGDGVVSIAAGTIGSGTIDITVEELDRIDFPDADGRWSDVFEFGPDATTFDIPVTISLALDADRTSSAATLWTLNQDDQAWEEVELSYTSQGRVWGQTTHFSIFTAGPASAPTECTMQDIIALRTRGNVEVLVADLDVTHLVGGGTLFEQETGSRWITVNNTFTVQGLAGPPSGQGRWIDFGSGPVFENGVFDIAADGSFSIPFDIPPRGFRFIGLTDACLGPFVSETNGWLYHLEVWCGPNCGQNVNAPPCQFPRTVTMQPIGTSTTTVAVDFGFMADEECSLGDFQGLVRALTFTLTSSGMADVTVIMGLNRWTILSSSEGTETFPGGRWSDLPDATEIAMTLQDADDSNAPIYELRYRFDGDQFTVRSFIEP